jgi:hypothetical protein
MGSLSSVCVVIVSPELFATSTSMVPSTPRATSIEPGTFKNSNPEPGRKSTGGNSSR